MFEIVRKINHFAAAEIEIDASHRAGTGRYLRDRFRWHVDAKEMVLAFDSGFEIDRFAVVRPFQLSGNQVESVRRERCRRSTGRWRQPNLRMIAIVKFAGEGDPFSVRRPAR